MPVTTNLSLGNIRTLEERIKSYLKNLAVKKGIVASVDQAIVRDILQKTDLSFTNEEWSESLTTANAFNTIVDFKLPEKKIIVFYGVRNIGTSPKTTAIKFALGANGAKTKDIVFIEGLEKNKEKEVIFSTPILYEDGQYMYIQQYAKATGTDNLVYLGFVCEPKGEIISQ
jgi:hypothetical protein